MLQLMRVRALRGSDGGVPDLRPSAAFVLLLRVIADQPSERAAPILRCPSCPAAGGAGPGPRTLYGAWQLYRHTDRMALVESEEVHTSVCRLG